MSARRVLLISRGASYGRSALDVLSDQGFELVEGYEFDNLRDEETLAAALDGFWGVIAGGERYSRRTFELCPSLQVVARFGAGYDHVDLEAAREFGVRVVTAPATNSSSVADYTVALILAAACRVLPADAAVRAGAWRPGELAMDLAESTVGIVGFGAIGRGVAGRLSGFGARLIASDPTLAIGADDLGAEVVSFDEVIRTSDIVSLHVPGGAATRNLVDGDVIRSMKPGSILINTCRGSVVDHDALAEGLSTGHLRGAGLDVFDQEPLPPTSKLLGLPNVIVSGHIASFSARSVTAVCESLVDDLLTVSRGEKPENCVA